MHREQPGVDRTLVLGAAQQQRHVDVAPVHRVPQDGSAVEPEPHPVDAEQARQAPATASGDHHHGEAETSIYVVSGRPEFVFHDGAGEVRVRTAPGDHVFVLPFVPHREENPDPDEPAVVVISRSTQEGSS